MEKEKLELELKECVERLAELKSDVENLFSENTPYNLVSNVSRLNGQTIYRFEEYVEVLFLEYENRHNIESIFIDSQECLVIETDKSTFVSKEYSLNYGHTDNNIILKDDLDDSTLTLVDDYVEEIDYLLDEIGRLKEVIKIIENKDEKEKLLFDDFFSAYDNLINADNSHEDIIENLNYYIENGNI